MHKRRLVKRHHENHDSIGSLFREFILGGQDGLVNVLGVLLGVAIGTGDPRAVVIAGLAATFAESVSMGAVAYTSSKSQTDYYKSQEQKELFEIETVPNIEKKEIYDIYYKKGFRGSLLKQVVNHIVSDKKRWKDVMMKEELNLTPDHLSPYKSAIVVFFAALIGSFIPLLPFLFLSLSSAIILSVIISAIALFITGALEAKFTVGNWIKKGFQLSVIGMTAAVVGFLVGKFTGYA